MLVLALEAGGHSGRGEAVWTVGTPACARAVASVNPARRHGVEAARPDVSFLLRSGRGLDGPRPRRSPAMAGGCSRTRAGNGASGSDGAGGNGGRPRLLVADRARMDRRYRQLWIWWLHQAVHGTPWLYWPQTIAQFYLTTALPTFFFYYVYKMRRPVEPLPQPGLRVALITLCVPGHESLDVIRRAAGGLVAGSPTSTTAGSSTKARLRRCEALAEYLGVRYFTRRGCRPLERAAGRRSRRRQRPATSTRGSTMWATWVCDYDVFVQFDIDHRPRRDYLERVLRLLPRPTRSPGCRRRVFAETSTDWTARGLAEQDVDAAGPFQMGFYGAQPHAVHRRLAHVISHLGHRRDRRLPAHPRRGPPRHGSAAGATAIGGVYVPELIAVGDGPTTFPTYLRQQFAWAYWMIQMFLSHTPRAPRTDTRLRQALQILMCQSWYALWSASLASPWGYCRRWRCSRTRRSPVSLIGRFPRLLPPCTSDGGS